MTITPLATTSKVNDTRSVPSVPALPETPVRSDLVSVFDYSTGKALPASLDDPIAKQALEVADAQARWYRDRFGYSGLDGKGTPFRVGVHAPNGGQYERNEHITLAKDGGDHMWKPMHADPEFYRHEFVHGIIEGNAPVKKWPAGEWSIVHEAFGMLLQTIDDNDWLINEDMMQPTATSRPFVFPYDIGAPKYRSVNKIPAKAAFPGADMERKLTVAHVGVIAAEAIGRDKVGDIWFDTIRNRLDASMDVLAAAGATVEAATGLYGESAAAAVRDAWRAVGILS